MLRTSIVAVLMTVALLPASRGQEFVCALSDNQTEFSIKAFDQLSPIFTEPRCFNCHGGVNPFNSEEPGHPNSALPFFRLPNGEEDFVRTFAQCQECHGNFPDWRLAPKAMQFKGRDMVGTCTLMKQQFPGNASKFIGHMINDNGSVPFLNVAFAGTMGLNSDGQDALMQDKYPDPPTMSRTDMLKFSYDWVDAMGGKFHNPDQCGCVDMKYALRVGAHGTLQMPGFIFKFAFRSGQLPEIPIHFHDDGTLSGETALTADTSNSGSLPMVSCSGDRPQEVGISISGKWPDIQTQHATGPLPGRAGIPQNKIKVTVSLTQIQSDASETCSAFGRVVGSNKAAGRQAPNQVQLSLDPVVDATQTVPWTAPMPGWSGEVQATIIRIK